MSATELKPIEPPMRTYGVAALKAKLEAANADIASPGVERRPRWLCCSARKSKEGAPN